METFFAWSPSSLVQVDFPMLFLLLVLDEDEARTSDARLQLASGGGFQAER